MFELQGPCVHTVNSAQRGAMAVSQRVWELKVERVGPMMTARDRQEALDILAASFPKAPEPGMREHMVRAVWNGPTFCPEHTRIAVADGRVVSVIVMAPRMVRFGTVTVPAMTIGPVATHDAYRKRGFCAATMHDCARYMTEKGYCLAYLQGNSRLYGRFGYFRYMMHVTAKVRTDDAVQYGWPGRLRTMTRADIPRVARLYDHAAVGRPMAAARDAAVWDWAVRCAVHTWLFMGPKVVLDAKGRLCGYVTINAQGEPGLRELVVSPDEPSMRVTLGALGAVARKRGAETFSLPVPWNDPFAVFLRQVAGAEFQIVSRSSGGPLAKIVDFPALMRQLQPLFTERWRAAHSALPARRFTLASEIGSVSIAVTPRGVRVSEGNGSQRAWIPQRWLTGLVTGCWAMGEVIQRDEVRVPARLVPLLEVLFPASWPYSHRGDLY